MGVYNLRVEGPSEYYANGFLVHNCDALEGAIRIAADIAHEVVIDEREDIGARIARSEWGDD